MKLRSLLLAGLLASSATLFCAHTDPDPTADPYATRGAGSSHVNALHVDGLGVMLSPGHGYRYAIDPSMVLAAVLGSGLSSRHNAVPVTEASVTEIIQGLKAKVESTTKQIDEITATLTQLTAIKTLTENLPTILETLSALPTTAGVLLPTEEGDSSSASPEVTDSSTITIQSVIALLQASGTNFTLGLAAINDTISEYEKALRELRDLLATTQSKLTTYNERLALMQSARVVTTTASEGAPVAASGLGVAGVGLSLPELKKTSAVVGSSGSGSDSGSDSEADEA